MYTCGPYGENHATAATFAFKRALLNDTTYDVSACLGEEKTFLKNYSIPLAQLDPAKTILVFSHNQWKDKAPKHFNAVCKDFFLV